MGGWGFWGILSELRIVRCLLGVFWWFVRCFLVVCEELFGGL